ncbi:MAG: hypothetical protein P9F75_03270 [Candidatus Contendobacter sp.]|nr:hypothetical protein [Candidatus Contendobacter sp.]
MKTQRNNLSVIFAILAGIALWGLAALVTTKREPWDDSIYWVAIYPLAIGISAMLAFRYPQNPILLTLVVFQSQLLAMCVRSGELGNLWPLGMALFAVIALPGMLAAKVAAGRSPYQAGSGSQG